ncbi:MAG: TIM barrel protein [Bacteroidota bacterium]
MNPTRRNFLKSSLGAGASFAFGASSFFEENKVSFSISPDFKLKIYATNWGFEGDMMAFCEKAKESGYDGIELWAPRGEEKVADFKEAVEKYGLSYGFLVGNWGKTYEEHLRFFRDYVDYALEMKPDFINCHSGKDFFSFEQNQAFIEHTNKRNNESGIPISHETHRGRMLFNAPLAQQFIEAMSDLRLTLDISHWTVVHESLLEDQQEAVDLALERTDHVHSRVGFQEGPQIPEPRAPEYKSALDAHFSWWDKVVEHKSKAGETLSMTTEFGPPGYMWALPYTQQPLANLWEVNSYMKDLWRERYDS